MTAEGNSIMVRDWVKLELDVRTFDPARFTRYVERCQAVGIRLVTLAELGDAPGRRRALYELNKECSADIPERGAFYTFEEYRERRIEVPSFDARGVVIALDGDTWSGLAVTSDHRSDGYVFNEMTGVKTSYRRRGIAVAMKVAGIGFAGLCGVHNIRTLHHPANTAAIEMNRRLGYTDADWET
jgi:GNAT superfamily N-acetyltransferase